eukprot:2994582-Pyramimonas_sp.AAC.1
MSSRALRRFSHQSQKGREYTHSGYQSQKGRENIPIAGTNRRIPNVARRVHAPRGCPPRVSAPL